MMPARRSVAGNRTLGSEGPRQQARAARAVVEAALASAGWPWSRRLSLWIDALVLLEEETR